jgi:hypothetical protein
MDTELDVWEDRKRFKLSHRKQFLIPVKAIEK